MMKFIALHPALHPAIHSVNSNILCVGGMCGYLYVWMLTLTCVWLFISMYGN